MAAPPRLEKERTMSRRHAAAFQDLLPGVASGIHMKYTECCGFVTLHVIQATGLAAKDSSGTSDPYCLVKCQTNVDQKTSVKKKNLNPTWSEVIKLKLFARSTTVKVEVWDYNLLGAHSFMGCVSVNISDLPHDGKFVRGWHTLQGRGKPAEEVKGKIELMIRYEAADSPSPEPFFTPNRRDFLATTGAPVLDPGGGWDANEPLRQLNTASDVQHASSVEDPPTEINWYKRFFQRSIHKGTREGIEHYVGSHDDLIAKIPGIGVVVISVLVTARSWGFQFWVIEWRREEVKRVCIELDERIRRDAQTGFDIQDLLPFIDPPLVPHAKLFFKVPYVTSLKYVKQLVQLENSEPVERMKIGVLFARQDQVNENDMFANKDGSANFERFLDLLGQRVELKGYKGYAAQLDVENGGSGTHSVTRTQGNIEFMFHVSTLMQYDPTDPQRIQRKRFIGNDIVVIVFMDGDTTYAVQSLTSQYTNIILVVQQRPGEDVYRVHVARKKGLRDFGPDLVYTFPRTEAFTKELIYKCVNGERSAKVSPEFLIRDRRTRNTYLEMLYENVSKNDDWLVNVGKKSVVVGESVLAMDRAIPAVPPQVFMMHPVLDSFNNFICSITTHGDTVLYADEKGVWANNKGKEKFELVIKTEGVAQIMALAAANCLFVRTEASPKSQSKLFVFPLSAVLASAVHGAFCVPVVNPRLFSCGVVAGIAYIFVASTIRPPAAPGAPPGPPEHVVTIFRCNGPSDVNKIEGGPLQLEGAVTVLRATPTGVLIASFEPDHEDEATSLTALHIQATPSGRTETEMFALHTGKKAHGPPLDAFWWERGAVLCYERSAVFITHDGLVDETMQQFSHWTGRPVHFASHGPYLIVYYMSFVEVRSMANNAIIEMHPGLAHLAPFSCSGAQMYSVSFVEKNHRMYLMTPIKAEMVKYVFSDDEDTPAPPKAAPSAPGSCAASSASIEVFQLSDSDDDARRAAPPPRAAAAPTTSASSTSSLADSDDDRPLASLASDASLPARVPDDATSGTPAPHPGKEPATAAPAPASAVGGGAADDMRSLSRTTSEGDVGPGSERRRHRHRHRRRKTPREPGAPDPDAAAAGGDAGDAGSRSIRSLRKRRNQRVVSRVKSVAVVLNENERTAFTVTDALLEEGE